MCSYYAKPSAELLQIHSECLAGVLAWKVPTSHSTSFTKHAFSRISRLL